MEQIMEQREMKMDEFRKNITSDLRIRTLIEKQTEGITNATDEAVAAFYAENKAQFNTPESVQASHILVKFEKNADEATKAAKKAEIEGYRKDIIDGTNDFATVAAAHSDCPSGQKGGDLGSFGRGQMVPEFEKAAFEQEIGAVGPVIETQFGYHIIQVVKRTEGGERTLEDVKEELIEQLTNRSKQEAVEIYITKLRDAAEITHGDK
jgi:peptidyl-prolyl cis-trans isomerase C